MTNSNDTQTLSTLDPMPARRQNLSRRLAGGVAVFALGAGLGWLGGAVSADATVAVVPEAVSSPRSPDAVERSALPAAPEAVSSPRSADAVERSASAEAERQARISEADCLRWSRGSTAC